MLREKKQLQESITDEEEDVEEVSQKRKPGQKVRPSSSVDNIKKKKKKNDGMAQESQFVVEDEESDTE